uniref:Uncharacterized protein n=1 Tax=Glossina pallidipes TaxID=7398 RepID=A0A1A9Z384_GLOPL
MFSSMVAITRLSIINGSIRYALTTKYKLCLFRYCEENFHTTHGNSATSSTCFEGSQLNFNDISHDLLDQVCLKLDETLILAKINSGKSWRLTCVYVFIPSPNQGNASKINGPRIGGTATRQRFNKPFEA